MNVRTGPLLSVVVPTRERARTLASTVATALQQDSDAFEVLVSDNASEDDTAGVVAGFRDPRLRYVRTPERLSMVGNYEFAFGHARGTHSIYIGDDDAVIPGALDALIARLAADPQPRIYMWPLHIYDWPAGQRAAEVAHLAPERPERRVDLKAKARTVMSFGGWKYYELPSPYHSAVPRAVLEAIRARTGRVFHSTQPDVFTALAIPAFADSAIDLGRTVTFNGRSPKSNGLGFVDAQARANIERFIREYGDYPFHPTLLERAGAMANMIPDAVLVARDLFPELYADTPFDYSAMWAYLCRLGFAGPARVLAWRREIARRHPFSLARFLAFLAVHEASAVRRRILNRLTPLGELRGRVPSDIHAFANELAGRSDRPRQV